MRTPADLAARFDEVWSLRYSQRNAEAAAAAQSLAEAAQAEPELELVRASLARAAGDAERARRILEQVAPLTRDRGGRLAFHGPMETGLTALLPGDYAAAIEHFLTAARATNVGWKKCAALANAVFCLQQLGLPFHDTLGTVHTLHAELPDALKLPGVTAQLVCYERRLAFLKGDLARAVSAGAADEAVPSQDSYLREWIKALPWHGRHQARPTLSFLEAFARDSGRLHNGAYRLRTLMGSVHPDDQRPLRSFDAVDRLYLWVWRWLADPEAVSLERILDLFTGLTGSLKSESLTHDDWQMLRNASLWLALLGGDDAERVGRALGYCRVTTVADDDPVFAYERLLLERLFAWRGGDEERAALLDQQLCRHALHRAPDLLLPEICAWTRPDASGAKAANLPHLYASIRALDPSKSPEKPCFSVNAAATSLVNFRTSERIVSEAAASALLAFRAQPVLAIGTFVQEVFGVQAYDPQRHDKRIANLLSRLKKFFDGRLALRLKAGRVHLEGDLALVQFQAAGKHTLALLRARNSGWRLAPPSGAEIQTGGGEGSLNLEPNRWYTRRDIERLVGKPRSTVSRLLVTLCAEGQLIKEGHARATRYRTVTPH